MNDVRTRESHCGFNNDDPPKKGGADFHENVAFDTANNWWTVRAGGWGPAATPPLTEECNRYFITAAVTSIAALLIASLKRRKKRSDANAATSSSSTSIRSCNKSGRKQLLLPLEDLCNSHVDNQISSDNRDDNNNNRNEDRRLRKADFLQRANGHYGYSASPRGHIDGWRSTEFPSLIAPMNHYNKNNNKKKNGSNAKETKNSNKTTTLCQTVTTDASPPELLEVYLDYAGAALPSRSQLTSIFLTEIGNNFSNSSSSNNNIILNKSHQILANPHSTGPAAARTDLAIQNAVRCLQQFFGALPSTSGPFPMLQSSSSSPQQQQQQSNFNSQHPGYDIVFTSGSTEAFRIVSEQFPWTRCAVCFDAHEQRNGFSSHCSSSTCKVGSASTSSLFVYPQNSHTSVIGMRENVLQQNGAFLCKPLDDIIREILDGDPHAGGIDGLWKRETQRGAHSPPVNGCTCASNKNLLVLPMECNFGGDKPNVQEAIRRLHGGRMEPQRWYTMLDLSKAASTSRVNLIELNPDFACLSFYKIFGAPTGLGCLFVKRTAIDVLMGISDNETDVAARNNPQVDKIIRRRYFGGGSVNALLPLGDFVAPRSEPNVLASLSHGTIHFRGIAALGAGFDELHQLGGMTMIDRHTNSLAQELVRLLQSMRHANGRSAVVVYGAWSAWKASDFDEGNNPGPTVAFNMIRSDASFIGYHEISKLASLNSPPIQLRTGCFCNPGACQLALKLTDVDLLANYRQHGHVCGDQIDLVEGRPTGAIRVSFGKDSIWEDLDAFLVFLERMFVDAFGAPNKDAPAVSRQHRRPDQAAIRELHIFPIKSCASQRVQRWHIDSVSGRLRYDREFALVDSSGSAMRLQIYPRMVVLQPEINLDASTMRIRAPNQPDLVVCLDDSSGTKSAAGTAGVVNVCGNKCEGIQWGDDMVSEWFSTFLQTPCWLIRYSVTQGNDHSDIVSTPTVCRLAFFNEHPLLLVSEEAVETLNAVLLSQSQTTVCSRIFRPNLVVRRLNPPKSNSLSPNGSIEDSWKTARLLPKADSELGSGASTMTWETAGQCARCAMVDIDPSIGKKVNILRALSGYRRSHGQISFGIYLRGAGSRSGSGDADWILLNEGDVLCCE